MPAVAIADNRDNACAVTRANLNARSSNPRDIAGHVIEPLKVSDCVPLVTVVWPVALL